jgi:hypothetical protein
MMHLIPNKDEVPDEIMTIDIRNRPTISTRAHSGSGCACELVQQTGQKWYGLSYL